MIMKATSYRDIKAWQFAMKLVKEIYLLTRQWPHEELYTLTSQIRRAAISIPSNIAEGQGRRSPNDFKRFLSIAYGSLMEVECQLLISRDLGYLSKVRLETVLELTGELGRVLNGLRQSMTAVQW